MDINSLQGANTYTASPNATPPVDTTRRQDQTAETSRADLNSDRAAADQMAFEVKITQEAQTRLAAERAAEPPLTPANPPESQNSQNTASAYQKSQIVNIVA